MSGPRGPSGLAVGRSARLGGRATVPPVPANPTQPRRSSRLGSGGLPLSPAATPPGPAVAARAAAPWLGPLPEAREWAALPARPARGRGKPGCARLLHSRCGPRGCRGRSRRACPLAKVPPTPAFPGRPWFFGAGAGGDPCVFPRPLPLAAKPGHRRARAAGPQARCAGAPTPPERARASTTR